MRNLKGRTPLQQGRPPPVMSWVGITAGVVGLPLALAFGEGSGLGAVAGLYAAVSMGLFAGALRRDPDAGVGPDGAPMTVAVSVIVATQVESITEVFAIAVMAGILQILLGALRLGRFIALHAVLGDLGVHVGRRHHHHPEPDPAVRGQLRRRGRAAGGDPRLARPVRRPERCTAIVIGGFTLLVSIFWPTRLRRKYLPSTLAALIAGTVLSVAWSERHAHHR